MAKKDTATLETQEAEQTATAYEADASTAATEEKAAEASAEEQTVSQQADNTSGFYIYVGPTIRGSIQRNTIFRGTKAQALEKAADAIGKHKLVKTLIVSGDNLSSVRLKLKEKGNAHYTNYNRLASELRDQYADEAQNTAEAEKEG